MKQCAICGLASGESAPTCPACGEASWLARPAVILPRPPESGPLAHDGDEAIPDTLETPKPKRGRR